MRICTPACKHLQQQTLYNATVFDGWPSFQNSEVHIMSEHALTQSSC